MLKFESVAQKLALAGLKIGAIKIRPENPFTWASGWKSPIYCDNRMFLLYFEYRQLILEGLVELMVEHCQYKPELIKATIIAGTSTAGIPHGCGLANRMDLPFIYVREKPKDHGMKNQIEGIDVDSDLAGRKVLLVEDLVSTGQSSVNAVQAIRDAKAEIDLCLSIFTYNFPKAKEMFEGRISFKKEENKCLATPCRIISILQYWTLIDVAIKNGFLDRTKLNILRKWHPNPEKWSNDFKAKEAQKA